MRPSPLLLLGSALGLVLGACFTGEGTFGAICSEDNQCGVGQTCRNQLCGMCRDGTEQVGELCLGPSSEEIVFGEIADLLAINLDPDVDPDHDEMVAVVNDDCGGAGGECWDLRVLLPDDMGGVEAFEFFTMNVPGRVPKATLGNFDGDGVPDLVAAVVPLDPMADPSQLAVLYNFPEPGSSNDVDVAIFARSLEAADLDGNGLDDLLVGAELANTLVFIPSTGNGFGTERVLVSDPTPRLATPVDMDGDGDLDLIVASEVEATVGVDLNDGNADFLPQTRQQIGAGVAITGVASADFDADGNIDVVVIAASADDATAPLVAVFRGMGNGQLEPHATMPGGELPVDVLAEDINFDGQPDIMVADLLEDKLPVHINRDGDFPDQVGIDVAAAPATLLRGDFDRDELVDLVIGNANGVISVVRSEN